MYQVSIVDTLQYRGSNCDGLCLGDKKEIYIKDQESDEYLNHVMLHEICHAILHESGMGETSLPIDLEEIIVDQIAKTLVNCFSFQPKGDMVCQKRKTKKK